MRLCAGRQRYIDVSLTMCSQFESDLHLREWQWGQKY